MVRVKRRRRRSVLYFVWRNRITASRAYAETDLEIGSIYSACMPTKRSARPAHALFLAVVVCLLLGGCSDPIATYYPLAVGNEWRFQTTFTDTGETRDHVELIVRRWESNYHFNNGERMIYFRNTGIINRNGVFILRIPLREGRRWFEEGVEMVIAATGISVDVPAGTFADCIEVTWQRQSEGRQFLAVTTYAPNVGPVRYDYYALEEDGSRELLTTSKLVGFRTGVRGDGDSADTS